MKTRKTRTVSVHPLITPTPTKKGIPIVPTKTPISLPIPAPSTTSSTVVLSTTPPVLNLPPIPAGFTPVNLVDYRGFHPRSGQVAALPDAVTELKSSTTYVESFGPAAPAEETFVSCLDDASTWSAARAAVESFLEYVKSQEAVAWKAALQQIEQAKAVYDVTIAQNPNLPTQFPALTRLLEVTNAIGKKSAASRKRGKATKAKEAAAASVAVAVTAAPPAASATASTVAPVAVTPAAGTGGAGAH